MTLPGSVFTTSAAAIINSLPQVPVPLTSSATSQGSYQLTVNLPTVPVASMQNQTQQIPGKCINLCRVLLDIKYFQIILFIHPNLISSEQESRECI